MDVKVSIVVNADSFTNFKVQTFNETVSDSHIEATQRIGTSEEALDMGDVMPGKVIITNLDPTNYVQLYHVSGGAAFSKLLPGETHAFRCVTPGLYAKANGAECVVSFIAFEV